MNCTGRQQSYLFWSTKKSYGIFTKNAKVYIVLKIHNHCILDLDISVLFCIGNWDLLLLEISEKWNILLRGMKNACNKITETNKKIQGKFTSRWYLLVQNTLHTPYSVIIGGFPIEIKTKIRYLMICCYLIFIR